MMNSGQPAVFGLVKIPLCSWIRPCFVISLEGAFDGKGSEVEFTLWELLIWELRLPFDGEMRHEREGRAVLGRGTCPSLYVPQQ